ncbi:ribose 5-phosphate isomerase B [Marivirga harenae]|uniref:ribose 5-phosphate isomerase B n=1 Tax=Marivirga harenae TaxID=2010992 RepID=UPI0026E03097|nr:ribose 5-phosphate isomerase B [Marivirga harenae]WKV13100.1 ribose 5-phosphate isomerase B [Marivirga harenae]|tara:strand:+ start:245512 stop:245940 length:429 start_codon:yes stop_codon:yes gene_type:complete
MKLAIGGDHAGFEYKKKLVEFLKKEGHEVKDFGPDTDASVDYPDHVHPLSEAVEKGEYELGILICGSANGVAMTANKHQGIRAGIAWEDELAALTRQHNNANIICIPARFIDYDKTQSIVKTFLTTEFEGGRHGRRVDKISC